VSLLGFLGNVATGFVTGGPVGAIAGGAASLLGSKGSAPAAKYSSPQVSQPSVNIVRQTMGAITPFANVPKPAISLPGAGVLPQIDSVKTQSGVQIPGLFSGPSTTTTYYSPAGGGAAGHACPVGYHWNRTSYYTKSGHVAKGTKCVRNRRRNPLNPRAMSRAMSRIHSAKKAAHFLDRIQIGPRRRAKR
jgi:hypothetical protein